MLSLEEAQDRLLAAVGEPLPIEEVALEDAFGRVLAEPIQSAVDLPPWDNSSMDGFAVHAADVASASADVPVRLRVVGEARAGNPAGIDLPRGEGLREYIKTLAGIAVVGSDIQP